MGVITAAQIEAFNHDGYLVMNDLLTPDEISYYREIYQQFLDDKINTGKFRSDLGGFSDGTRSAATRERITQIMLPGRLLPSLLNEVLHVRTLAIAKELLGDDMDMDFDMLI